MKGKNKLLEERIKQYGAPPLPYQPTFDRCCVWQIPEQEAETFIKGGVLFKPETTKAKEKAKTARGLLLAAGQRAVDELRGHGVGVGHIVWFSAHAPYRHIVGVDEKGTKEMLFLRAQNIAGSEDLLAQMRAGDVYFDDDDSGRYCIGFRNEKVRPRFDPSEQDLDLDLG